MESNTKVWIKKRNRWFSGIIVSKNNNQVLIKFDHNKKTEIIDNFSNIKLKNQNCDNINDLMNLQHLNEPSMLNALFNRYKKNTIYTYTGPILIAINPFKNLEIYDDGNIKNFNNNQIENPHLYGVVSKVYENIKKNKGNQSVLISGNSGSGKTFSTRYIMKYLSKVSSNFDTNENTVERKLLESNPILEAFGNAKTLMNDNSSRFGKYIKIFFDDDSKITGANIETYLLEKIRLINQKDGERNFHIFYLILSGMSNIDKQRYSITKVDDYRILSNSKCYLRDDGISDKSQYEELIQSFHIMNFTEVDIENIFLIISAILHLGNIVIKDNQVIDSFSLKCASKMLSIEYADLKRCFLQKEITVHGETFIKSLKDIESYNVITTMMKVIYENMFNWIVKKINKNFIKTDYKQFIGLLDIFGFEVFYKNNFEQICINYANESLQQQFNKYILKNEQKLYEEEQIEWDFIDFPDNKECLDLFEFKTHGLLSKFDEECLFPNGNDNALYDKICKYSESRDSLNITNMERIDKLFTIEHYPGKVTYNIHGFVAKNKDILNSCAVKCLFKSNNKIFKTFDKNLLLSLTTLSSISISKQFQNQLKELLETINKTTPHYIRCLKPNDKNRPDSFQNNQIINQLKYSGVLEAIKISRHGYPIRMAHEDFNDKYYMLFDKVDFDNKQLISILKNEKLEIDTGKYQVGITKIFLKKDDYEKIELMRNNLLNKSAIAIQKIFKGWRIKNWYISYKKSVIIAQKYARAYLARQKVKRMRQNLASIKIQSLFRGYMIRKNYKRVIKLIIFIQRRVRQKIKKRKYRDNYENYCATKIKSIWKMYIIRKHFIQYRNRVIVIQCHIKILLAKNLLIKLKNEKYNLDKLKNQNNLLQNNLNSLQEDYLKQQALMNQMRMKMKQQERENFQKEENLRLLNEQNSEKIEDVLYKNFELSNIINDYKQNEEESKQLLEDATIQNNQDAETKLLLAMKINELLLKHNNAVEELRRLRANDNNVSFFSFIRQFFQ